MQIHQLSVADALASVASSGDGLTTVVAHARLQEYGPNQVTERPKSSWLLGLLREFCQLFSMILWAAAALAFIAHAVDPAQDMARVGVAVVFVIVVSGAFSYWQESRVEHTLEALQRMLPQQVWVLRDGVRQTLAAQFLVPGDVIVLRQGDSVPADCRLIQAHGVRSNRSSVTGESRPQSCDSVPSSERSLGESRNILLAGTSLVAGMGLAVIFATGADTAFGRIAQLSQVSAPSDSPLRKEVEHLSRSLAVLAVSMGAAFLVLGIQLGLPFARCVVLALGIIIAMVPEGLVPTLTLSLVLAARRLSRRQVLIRHLPSVETMGSVSVICTDKTGTLTENRMQAEMVFLEHDVFAVQQLANRPELRAHNRMFFQVACDCHSLAGLQNGGAEGSRGDPLEVALVHLAQSVGTAPLTLSRSDEWPFDSDRMRHSVVFRGANDGPAQLLCKGALQSVLPLCSTAVLRGEVIALDSTMRRAINNAQESMAERGLRVIALAARQLPPICLGDTQEQDLTFCGLVGISDPPRPEVMGALACCRGAGIKVIMVTGDHPKTALAVARQIGLVHSDAPVVIAGEQLQSMAPVQLQLALDAPEILFARVPAEQKLRIVKALQAKGQIVAVTGDGVNDAPALRAADIGVSMGRSGTDVAREASDMVLLDDNFASIVVAMEEGRAIFQNIQKFLTYVLVHNMAELVPMLAYALTGIPLPLTAVQALAIDMGTDSLTALALGVEAGNPRNMFRPPRALHDRLLTATLAVRSYLVLGLIEAAAVLAVFVHTLQTGGWRYGSDLPASDALYCESTTASLAAIVVLQIVNVLLCRSAVRPIYETGLGGNRLMLWGIALEVVLILLISYTAWGNALLHTRPLPWDIWLYLLPWVAAMVLADTGWKMLRRQKQKL